MTKTLIAPSNLETEQALLGALLNTPERCIKDCWTAGLQPDDFSRPSHQIIYTSIVKTLQSGGSIDAISLTDTLRREQVPTERGKTVNALEFVGGSVAILTLNDQAAVPSLAKTYAEEIVSQSLSRDLMLVGEELQRLGSELAPIPEAVAEAERRLVKARDRAEGRRAGGRVSDVADLLQQLLEEYISPDPDDVIPFSLPSLNALGGGMFPGDVIVLGARSGVGKTWSGLDLVEAVMNVGRRAVMFSLEMPKMQLVRRIMAMGGINLTGLRRRLVPYEQLIERAGIMDAWRGLLDIEDGPTSVDRMQGVLASARIEGNPYRLLVLDHLHLMDVPGSRSDYRVSLNQELTRIKHMAAEHNLTVVLLGQLNRPKKGDEWKRPTIHDLRESGAIGDIADYVLMVHREYENGHQQNHGAVIVEKVRDGSGDGDIEVLFDQRNYRFREGRPPVHMPMGGAVA